MKDELKKAAEVLVACGYAQELFIHGGKYTIRTKNGDADDKYRTHGKHYDPSVDPFSDTLESRRQADAIEDWLCNENHSMWHLSEFDVCEKYENSREIISERQWRLDRIKWCLEQLDCH